MASRALVLPAPLSRTSRGRPGPGRRATSERRRKRRISSRDRRMRVQPAHNKTPGAGRALLFHVKPARSTAAAASRRGGSARRRPRAPAPRNWRRAGRSPKIGRAECWERGGQSVVVWVGADAFKKKKTEKKRT